MTRSGSTRWRCRLQTVQGTTLSKCKCGETSSCLQVEGMCVPGRHGAHWIILSCSEVPRGITHPMLELQGAPKCVLQEVAHATRCWCTGLCDSTGNICMPLTHSVVTAIPDGDVDFLWPQHDVGGGIQHCDVAFTPYLITSRYMTRNRV